MAAGEIYKYSGNIYLYYRDSSNVERRLNAPYTGVGTGFVSSVYTTSGMVDGRMVLGNWGTIQGNMILVAVFSSHITAWRYFGFPSTYFNTKPTGNIRISGQDFQVYANNTWLSAVRT